MRLMILSMLQILLVLSTPLNAQTPPGESLAGAWVFTWDGDTSNTNSTDLRYEGGTFTGTYINDAMEACPVVGRMVSSREVSLTIVCRDWDIRAEGQSDGGQIITGKYIAYGNSEGGFEMVRK